MAQLISQAQVISNAFTNKNTSELLIKDNVIEIAQEQHIRPVLTDDLYDDIVAKNNLGPLTDKDKILLEQFIIPALAFYVKFEVLPEINFNTGSKGTRVLGDEVSRSATNQERADLLANIKRHADTLREKITRFIQDEDNIDDFLPLYIRGRNVANTSEHIGGVIILKEDEQLDPDDIPFELRIL